MRRTRPISETLASGARLLVETDASIPLVDVDLVVRGGSVHDPVARDGLARLYARLLRRGTKRRALPSARALGPTSADALDEAIESLGGALAIDVTTSAIRFHGSVIRRNLQPFFALISSILLAPAMRPADLAFVRREAQAELVAQLDSDRWLASRAFRHALFATHPYGRSNTGTPETLEAITLRELRAFHEQRLRSGSVVVAFAGDVTAESARELVSTYLADLPRGEAVELELPEPRSPRGVRVVLVDKPDRTQTQLFVGTLGARMGERSFYPLLVANTVFGGTFSARLVREVRSERGWSYSAQSRLYADRARDAWVAYTHPAVEHVRDCLALELELVQRFVEGGVRAREVAFAKSYLTKSHAFDRDTAAKRLEPHVEAALFGLPLGFFEGYPERVAAVEAEAASAAVRTHLGGPSGRGTDLVVAVLGPRQPLERSLATVPGVSSLHVVPHAEVAHL
ncbi:MAG: insulinase family protein [Sandaracinaceae bacterium]|nr:insulinase family protein [Sandaracinaceae bacterium]